MRKGKLPSPELDVAREQLNKALHEIDMLQHKVLVELSPKLGKEEKAQLRGEFQMALAMRLVSLSTHDEQTRLTLAIGICQMNDEAGQMANAQAEKPAVMN